MELKSLLTGGRYGGPAALALIALAAPAFAPRLLAFPHKVDTAIGPVRSERPLDPAMLGAAVAEAQARLATTPLAERRETRDIFVTDGGWRWRWLALASPGAFALTRPFTRAVVVNATGDDGIVRNGRSVGGERRLGPVLAHEFTHGLIRRRFGDLASLRFASWKVEGYCDHVAGETSLSLAEARALAAKGSEHPAIVYALGRERVAAQLARDPSLERLFNGD